MPIHSNSYWWVFTTSLNILLKRSYWGFPSKKLLWPVIIYGWAIMYREIFSRGKTTYSKVFLYTCHGWSVFLIPTWYFFVFEKSNRSASRWNEICSTLEPTQLSSCAIRFHYITRKIWVEMCSIFLHRKIIYARYLYAWKDSEFFPPVHFYPISCLYDDDIHLKPFLYDDNFDHIWGDVASLFFPESWYKCDNAEHAPSYVDTLNLTSTA